VENSSELRRSAIIDRWGFAAILVAALGLRLYNLGLPGFWLDEAFCIWVARQDPAGFWTAILGDAHPPLYFLLLRAWGNLGWDETITRFPSVIFGIITLLGIYLLGRRLGGKTLGLLASLLWAVSTFALFADNEVRMYSPLTAFCTLSMLGLCAWLESGRARFLVLYGASILAALYTHYFALFILLAQVVAVAFFLARRGRLAGLALAGVAVLFGYLPWLASFRAQFLADAGAVLARPNAGIYKHVAWLIGGLGTVELPALVGWVIFALGLGLAGMGIWAWTCSGEGRSGVWTPLAWLVIPLLASWLVSVFTDKHVFNGRYFVVILPALFLLQARGIMALQKRWLAGGLVVFLVGLNLLSIYNYKVSPDSARYWRQDWRSIAQYVGSEGRPGDIILVLPPYAALALNLYYLPGESRVEFVDRKDYRMEFLPGYWSRGGLPQFGILAYDPELLAGLAGRARRIWLISNQTMFYDPDGRIPRWLAAHALFNPGLSRRTDSFWTGGIIGVLCYDLPAPAPGAHLNH